MRIDDIIHKLLPRDDKFFELLEGSAKNMVKVGEAFSKVTRTTTLAEREAVAKEVKDLEHNGDSLTHTIFTELNATFVTPFDREDIHLLASALDDVVDFIDGTASRIVLYKIDALPPSVEKLVEVLLSSMRDLEKGVHLLRNMNDVEALRDIFKSVNEYENQADSIFEHGVADLFENERDAIRIIKLKEVLVGLETATDMCEDAANVLEAILIKYN